MILWRWFDVYVVASDRGAAWAILVEQFGENSTAGPAAPSVSMVDAVEARINDEPGEQYDALDPIEYLHVVPPNDEVEFPSWALPSSGPGDIVPDATGADEECGYVTTVGVASADKWARILPTGTVVRVEL